MIIKRLSPNYSIPFSDFSKQLMVSVNVEALLLLSKKLNQRFYPMAKGKMASLSCLSNHAIYYKKYPVNIFEGRILFQCAERPS